MAREVNVSSQMIDILEPEQEVEVMYSGGALWVNVDGKCRLRITRIKEELMTWNIDHNRAPRSVRREPS